mgnify:CR=1 FL=1
MKISKQQEAWIDQVSNENPEALQIDGHDNAIIGISRKSGEPALLAYSEKRIIMNLVTFDGMSLEEAREFYEFNIAGAYMGPGTPVIVGD